MYVLLALILYTSISPKLSSARGLGHTPHVKNDLVTSAKPIGLEAVGPWLAVLRVALIWQKPREIPTKSLQGLGLHFPCFCWFSSSLTCHVFSNIYSLLALFYGVPAASQQTKCYYIHTYHIHIVKYIRLPFQRTLIIPGGPGLASPVKEGLCWYNTGFCPHVMICEAICERPRQTKRQMTPNEKANVTSPMTPIKYRETPKSSGPSEGHHLPSSSWSSTHDAHVAYNHAKFSMVLCMHFEDFRFGAQSNLWFGNETHGFLLFFMCLKHGKAASCISSWSWYLQPLHINSINRYQLLGLFECLKPTFRIQT